MGLDQYSETFTAKAKNNDVKTAKTNFAAKQNQRLCLPQQRL